MKWSALLILLVLSLGWLTASAAENVVVVNGEPVILSDPAQAWDWYDMQVMYNLYDPLVYPTPEGGIKPHIAISWRAVDGDLGHWEFTITPGCMFHDGTMITADDVVWSANRYKAMGGGGMAGVVSATAKGFYTAEFVLAQPNALFPETLAYFYVLNKDLILENTANGQYGEYGDYGNAWLQTHDAGSGPYMMVTHNAGVSLEAARFESYFLGWPATSNPDEVPIDRVIFMMESQYSTLLLMIRNRELDLEANGGWSLGQLADIARIDGVRVNYVWSELVTVYLNSTLPPTDDEHFRKAMLYAFDYEGLIAPYVPFGAREGSILLSSMAGYMPIEPQPRKQDLAKARAELALSKYADRLDEVEIVGHYCGGLTYEEDILLQLQANMAELGVKMEVAGPQWAEYGGECGTPDTTPNLTVWLFGPQSWPAHDFYTYQFFHGPNWIFSSHWYFGDPEIIRLLEETRATTDLTERIGLYEEVQPLIASHALALYAYEKPKPYVSQAYLIGPLEKMEFIGPEVSMRNWRINLTLKAEIVGN